VHVAVGWFHTAKIVEQRCCFCQFCQTIGGSTQLGRFERDLGRYTCEPATAWPLQRGVRLISGSAGICASVAWAGSRFSGGGVVMQRQTAKKAAVKKVRGKKAPVKKAVVKKVAARATKASAKLEDRQIPAGHVRSVGVQRLLAERQARRP
jgi:hypothetical protein